MRNLEVPGNILLLGEYAILEEGGLGVAMAIDRRISFFIEESDSFEIKGQWGKRTLRWTPENPESDYLIQSIYSECLKSIRKAGVADKIQLHKITIDTGPFRSPAGQKYGFGASAAVTCGLTYLLFVLAGLEGETDWQFNSALQSHRKAQGNQGSGYDIATSFYGGLGLFRGGRHPLWQPLDLPWLPPGYLFPGPGAIPTVSAISRYHEFKAENKEETDRFRSLSNSLVEQFIQAGNWPAGIRILRQYREESIRFQKRLNIDATLLQLPDFTEKDKHWIVKALGAGNELGALWGAVEINDQKDVIPICISETGPEWVSD